MHVLYHNLSKALALESGPPPLEMNVPTMQMAIAVVEALETIEGISEIVSSALKIYRNVILLNLQHVITLQLLVL